MENLALILRRLSPSFAYLERNKLCYGLGARTVHNYVSFGFVRRRRRCFDVVFVAAFLYGGILRQCPSVSDGDQIAAPTNGTWTTNQGGVLEQSTRQGTTT